VIQGAVLKSYNEEKETVQAAGYVCRYDEYDAGDFDELTPRWSAI